MKTVRKLIRFFLLGVVLLALPAELQAQFTYTTNNGAITITGYTGGGAVIIPSTINGYPVTTIGDGVDSVFANTEVTSVIIGTNVTSIGTAAFSYCTSLASVTIPNSVTSIGPGADDFAYDYPGAFEGCTRLTSVIIPNSLTEIPDVTFSGCTSLASVMIGTNVTSIGYEAFYDCGLTNMIIPNSVTSIGGGWPYLGAFEGCASLTSVTIPNSLTEIGDLVFSGCGLTSVTIPDSVTTIGDGAFGYCFSLTNVTIPNSVTSIGDGITGEGAFQGCQSLASVTIPASVAYFAELAFAGCYSLTSVYFLGDAPGWIDAGDDQFENDTNAIGYYLTGTSGWATEAYITVEPWIPGSLQVTITPAAAITAGAQWEVDGGGVWQNSGAMVTNLSAGSHTVSFSPVSGWTTPTNQTVSVSTNLFAIATATGAYIVIPPPPSPFTTLYTFSATPASAPFINSDGSLPQASLILSDNTLYGTASGGGSDSYGTVFRVNIDGTGFTNLHNFTGLLSTNSDGKSPLGSLILWGNTLYGTTYLGGTNDNGTVFKVNTDGTGFTILHTFSATPASAPFMNSDGALPETGLILSGNTLYGTASSGGSWGVGTVFKVNTDGLGFTNVHSFGAYGSTNRDGECPFGSLILSGSTLYGTANRGGSLGSGTVFAVNTDGTGFTNLHNFTGFYSTNTDGAFPYGGLTLLGNTLYGAAQLGGTSGDGTVFAVKTDGTGFTNLYNFTGVSDGMMPSGGLILSGNTLYGMTSDGGSSGYGTLFALNTDGAGFTNLYNFTALYYETNSDGAAPSGGLILSGNTLYGTAYLGGTNGNGTVFSLSLGSVSVQQGSLQITISPPGAISAGAQWQVETGVYQSSGTTASNLPAGVQTISFVPIFGWETPPDQTVTITNALTTTASGVYTIGSALLTVSTNGEGSLSTNYNGALLQIGQTYAITATAGTGFVFTNWTGGTNLPLSVLTNGLTVQFMMEPNLMLQANFVATNKPTLAITNVPAGLTVSNAAFTVKGTAGGRWPLTNVFYSLNGGGWNNAASGNGWTNWTAALTLIPGTNTIAAYAVDTFGNVSPTKTNTVVFKNVVSAFLTVNINGGGTVTPNYNGELLPIGQTFSMTATTNAGSAFTGWTGSMTTNTATLTFVMASNLVFTANFADIAKPINAITAPVANQQVSNSVFTVTGKAGDNVGVSNVWVQLNNGGWNMATTTNQWSNWTAQISLQPDTNTVQAYAVDTSGNVSTTNTVFFQYVLKAPLTVQMSGRGAVSPNDSNALLQVDSANSIKAAAVAGSGFAFSNWTGGTSLPLAVLTNGATLRFVMVSNLVLQANFVDTNKPTLAITNVPAGLTVTNAVFTVKGRAGDNVQVADVYFSLNNTGWSNAVTGNNWTNWTAQVTLIPGSNNTVQAYAVDTSGNVSATNQVSINYWVPSVLNVEIVGEGTLTPDYNGRVLGIGDNYTMKATATNGFAFYYWGGGVPMSTNATLTFTMASNLTITANFKDVTKPTNAITFPAANQTWSNSVITVTGKASDNVGVAAVWYQINNGGWAAAGTTNSFTNWSIPNLVVIAGTNLLQAYAEDAAGNVSVTNAVKFRCILPPAGMVLIPAGWFNMGDALDGESDAVPVRSVYVSAFYMDTNLVSYSQWQLVYNWATSQGYGFVNAGAGKAANHPVQTVDWYDVVKWCNARSQQAGLVPVYYTDAGLTQVYTNGDFPTTIYVNWTNSGYRLPTEAEWEKAARGGLSGQRFPWGNFISETNANYCLGPNDYNPIGSIGGTSPATSPVGSFAANGYGLYDMAGNVYEWCWDWYGTPYAGTNNPHGPGSQPSSDPTRVERGGGWDGYAYTCQTAHRSDGAPAEDENDIGFRSVMSFSPNGVPPVITMALSVPRTSVGNNNIIFQLSGPPGSNYVLQVSTNLSNWSSVNTSTIPISGTITLSNAMGGYNRRFYRTYLQ